MVQSEFYAVLSSHISSNLKQAPRYKGDFLAFLLEQLLNPLVFILFIPILNLSQLEQQIGTSNILGFLIVGFSVALFNRVALYHLAAEIRALLFGGQLEYVFSLPLSKYKYLVAVATGLCVWYAFPGIPMFLLGLFIAGSMNLVFIAIAIFVVILQIYLLIQIGVLFALLVLKEKTVDSILAVTGIVVSLISGAIIPIQTFPQFLQVVALVFPPTIGLDCVRILLLDSEPILSALIPGVSHTIAIFYYIILMLFEAVLFTLLAKKMTHKMVEKAFVDGLRYL